MVVASRIPVSASHNWPCHVFPRLLPKHFESLGDMTDVNDTEQVPWQDVMDTVISAIENGHRNSEFSQIKIGDFP